MCNRQKSTSLGEHSCFSYITTYFKKDQNLTDTILSPKFLGLRHTPSLTPGVRQQTELRGETHGPAEADELAKVL